MRITLCGSTRFEPLFHEWAAKLALAGHTVYSLSLFAREASDIGKDGKLILTDEQKITLDLVHFDKILNSDAIVVLNHDGYAGSSTRREVQWARLQRKTIYWLEGGYSAENLADKDAAELLLQTIVVAVPETYRVVEPPIPLVPQQMLDSDIPF